MNKRLDLTSFVLRTTLAVTAVVGLAGCGTGSGPKGGTTGEEVADAEDLRKRLVGEGFPCAEGEKEGTEGRTLSQCESGILLAVFDEPEVGSSVGESYVDSGKHVLQDEKWIVVDFQKESRLPRYKEALGGEIVEK